MSHNNQKKIATINDISGFGRCSISVTLPIVSALKIQCCPLPTSIFSNHTGFDSFFYTDFTQHMQAYMNEWHKLGLRFNGILTGFLGSPEQIDLVQQFFKLFKDEKTIVVVDPVMGDYGKLYRTYSTKLANELGKLVPFATILTPNLTEACFLTGNEYYPDMSNAEVFDICRKLSSWGPHKIVITGLERGNQFDNIIYEEGREPTIVSAQRIGPCRSGTGDVFSSIVIADAVNEVDFVTSIQHASKFIEKAMRRALELDLPLTDGVCFEELLQEL